MIIQERAYSGESDLRVMEALASETRKSNLHVTDLPYRFTSWAMDNPENSHLWSDEAGHLLAWAILQCPWAEVDFVCHPEAESEILPKILTWADARSREHYEMIPLGTPAGEPGRFVNIFSDQAARIRALEAAGYTCQADMGEDSWSKVFMQRPADLPVKEYRIPEGFVVRPLAGESEADAYVRLHRETFRSQIMTVEWRKRMLRHPDYTPDLDLVVAAPDGRLAAFCICWLESHSSEKVGQIEPLGCHRDFRHYALGRVALAEGLRKLQAHGAKKIYVETDNWRKTAFQLYESLGFQVVRDVLVYRKDYQ
ncbi:MAG: GNAT family N-acetyltransferase [Anaerolineales bacterium]|jgi:ribosomal protein S18 acetylase RimI-like enzyme